jgi:hypothetical protein
MAEAEIKVSTHVEALRAELERVCGRTFSQCDLENAMRDLDAYMELTGGVSIPLALHYDAMRRALGLPELLPRLARQL